MVSLGTGRHIRKPVFQRGGEEEEEERDNGIVSVCGGRGRTR